MPVRQNAAGLPGQYGSSNPHLTLDDEPCLCESEHCCHHDPNLKQKNADGDTEDDGIEDEKSILAGKNGSKLLDNSEDGKVTLFFPPPLAHSCQPGVLSSALYSGSKFCGCQKSKDSSYDVEVVFKVCSFLEFLLKIP